MRRSARFSDFTGHHTEKGPIVGSLPQAVKPDGGSTATWPAASGARHVYPPPLAVCRALGWHIEPIRCPRPNAAVVAVPLCGARHGRHSPCRRRSWWRTVHTISPGASELVQPIPAEDRGSGAFATAMRDDGVCLASVLPRSEADPMRKGPHRRSREGPRRRSRCGRSRARCSTRHYCPPR
jgi:hypothetical protein